MLNLKEDYVYLFKIHMKGFGLHKNIINKVEKFFYIFPARGGGTDWLLVRWLGTTG